MAWKNDDAQRAQSLLADRPTMKMLQLNADDFTVTVTGEGVALDLGGIGKGYAVDVIAETLDEWGVDKVLIHAGASSIRALNPPTGKNGWPVTLTNPIDQTTIARLEMKNEVFSCSGLQGGQHIINPFTGQAVSDRRACWMRLKENAALVDALTTAGMIMPVGNLHSLQDALPGLSVMVLMTPQDQSPQSFFRNRLNRRFNRIRSVKTHMASRVGFSRLSGSHVQSMGNSRIVCPLDSASRMTSMSNVKPSIVL
jgi:thiamine biosynthesis lipoprotein ApbE